jgi:ankyrin repeat protein
MAPDRTITSNTSLENLRREAKRWLKALRAKDADARARFDRARPGGPPNPTLRDIQVALAREYGFAGWTELKTRLSSAGVQSTELSALLAEAERGHAAEVARIVDAHPDLINMRGTLPGHTGLRTALHFGVNHFDVVRALLQRGADPNIRDEGDDATPLHFAAEHGNLDIVRALVEHGADTVGEGTYHELNVLGWAVGWANVHHALVAEYLLAHGAKHTIHTAVALGDTDAVRRLVAIAPDEIRRPMDGVNRRRTPLHLAVIKRQMGALETLLELGADPDAGDVVGLTALDQAALDGATELAEALIAGGAHVGFPAAVALGREEDVARLLREEPGALRPGGRWARLIIHAASHCSGAVIDALIRCGASVGVIDEPEGAIDGTRNYTALHAAAFHGNLDTVRVLLAHGANVRVRDSNYRGTPAGWADYARKQEARDLILDGDIDIFDAIDMKPERIPGIVERDPEALTRPFGEYAGGGSDDNLRADTTPLQWAERCGKADVARALRALGAENGSAPTPGRG